jgi:GT2 family glycosyltransferase
VSAVAGKVADKKNPQRIVRRKKWPRVMDALFFNHSSNDRVEGIASFKGGNHSVRVNDVKEIGGYDEHYIGMAHREESDFAIRLWKSGRLIVFDPDAGLVHLGAPAGGCRHKEGKKQVLKEWMITFPSLYFMFRHWFPNRWFFYFVFIVSFRAYVLRRENVVHPWRLPWAVLSYMYSVLRALVMKIYVEAGGIEKMGYV